MIKKIPRAYRMLLSLALLMVLNVPVYAQSTWDITRTSSPTFYLDEDYSFYGMYVAYEITNTSGTDYSDIWVTLEDFAPDAIITLAPNEDGVVRLGPIASGESKTAFFYLQTSGATLTTQSHTVKVYDGEPAGSELASSVFGMDAEDTIQANSNTIAAITLSPNPPVLGAELTLTVSGGSTGTLGDSGYLSFTPASELNWLPDTFELQSSSITFDGDITGTFTDQLLINGTKGQQSTYTAVYTFLNHDFIEELTCLKPVAYIASGTAEKHTHSDSLVGLDCIEPFVNTTTLTKSASTTNISPGPGTVTYTVMITNTHATASITLDNIIDTLPVAPDAASYIANSSTYDGGAIDDPKETGQQLTWTGPFVVPANSSVALTYDVTIPSTEGTYSNSVVAMTGKVQIDTTLDTTDNAPATALVGVCTSDADSDGACDADDVCPDGDDNIDSDRDGAPDACDDCPDDPAKATVGCGCGVADTPDCGGSSSGDASAPLGGEGGSTTTTTTTSASGATTAASGTTATGTVDLQAPSVQGSGIGGCSLIIK